MTGRHHRTRRGDGPGRRSERGRTLPAPPLHRHSRDPFAVTWWGRAWLQAMEGAAPDPGRLGRGRTYARGGYVTSATVTPGRLAAYVRGSRPRPYRVDVRLREFTDEEWDAFLDTVADRPAHIAALLDGDMPPALVGDAQQAGVRLLPDAGEPELSCTCPDHEVPCKHSAALCYTTARYLDDDPCLLLLLRGRGKDEIIDELDRRNAAHTARTAEHAPGDGLPTVAPLTALATAARPPLPDPLPLPEAPSEGPALPDSPAPGGSRSLTVPESAVSGEPDPLDPEALAFLAADAAGRAHACLADPVSSPLPRLTPWRDAVRMAATHPRLTGRGLVSRSFARLAAATGGTAEELARAAAAWRQGGETGLAVLQEPWDPPAGDFDRGRSALAVLGLRMVIDRNRLTAGALQLRYGRDGRWYPYRAESGSGFWPEGPSAVEVTQALRAFDM